MALSAQSESQSAVPSAERLPGERYWWIDGTGRVVTSEARPQVIGTPTAEGRVSESLGLGVIERIDGREGDLGLLGRETIDRLAARFGAVRWAIADRAACASGAAARSMPSVSRAKIA